MSVEGDRKNICIEVLTHAVEKEQPRTICYWQHGGTATIPWYTLESADEPQDLAFTFLQRGNMCTRSIWSRGKREASTVGHLHSGFPTRRKCDSRGITEGSAEIAGSLGEQQQILISLDTAVTM